MADDAPPPRVLELTPLNPAFREDPYAVLANLRSRHPVMRDDLAGVFFISRHEDVRGILTDLTLWRDPNRAEPAAVLTRRILEQEVGDTRERDGPGSILLMDDPDHARIRTPLAQALYKRVAKCRPLVEDVVAEALDAVEGQETFELMAAVSLPVPVDVIARILGVDHTRLAEFRDWSEGIIQSLNPLRTPAQTEHMVRASEAIGPFMIDMMEKRRRKPEDDLVTDMVQLQAAGADLSDADLATNLIALLVAGNLTTTDLIGNGARLFLLNPGELDKLKADPSLIGAAVEEVLRYEPPVDITGRIASREMEVHGCPVHATSRCWSHCAAPTATRKCSKIRSVSTSPARRAPMWLSAAAHTSASARRWPVSRPRWRCCACSSASPTSVWPIPRPSPSGAPCRSSAACSTSR